MTDLLTTEGLSAALADEVRAAIEAVAGRPLSLAEALPTGGEGWGTAITATGTLDGRITVWVDQAGVRAIGKAMAGLDEPPDPAVAGEMLRELFAQAAAATAIRDGFRGLTLVAAPPVPGTVPAAGAAIGVMDGARALAVLTFGGSVAPAAAAAGAATAGRPAPAAGPAGAYPGNLAALLDVDLPLVVRFARTEMSLRSLTQLGPGSMVDMGRSPEAPVQLLIGSQVIAEGEVVVVAGNYGVRITSLVSPADRLKAMEL